MSARTWVGAGRGFIRGAFAEKMSWPPKSGHSEAKLSYGGGVREIDRRAWILNQVWSGKGFENGKRERRAKHATQRSGVECADRSGGFATGPIFLVHLTPTRVIS